MGTSATTATSDAAALLCAMAHVAAPVPPLHNLPKCAASELLRQNVQVLVDVGAGNGYFSLAAAARGHDVIAFELSNASVASFEASARYNGFQKAITLHKVSLLGPLACVYGPLSWPSFLPY